MKLSQLRSLIKQEVCRTMTESKKDIVSIHASYKMNPMFMKPPFGGFDNSQLAKTLSSDRKIQYFDYDDVNGVLYIEGERSAVDKIVAQYNFKEPVETRRKAFTRNDPRFR